MVGKSAVGMDRKADWYRLTLPLHLTRLLLTIPVNLRVRRNGTKFCWESLTTCRIDPTVKSLRPRRGSNPRMDATHTFVLRVLYQLSFEAKPRGIRMLHKRISRCSSRFSGQMASTTVSFWQFAWEKTAPTSSNESRIATPNVCILSVESVP